MRRLREHQLVTLELDRPSASIECLVLGIDGAEATLEPVDATQLALLSTEGHNALLTFEYRSQLITLRGTARRDDIESDARFAVTDRVTVPQRRRYARVEVGLPIRVMALGDDDAAGGDTIDTRTRDLSADGLLVEELLPAAHPRWLLSLELPDSGPVVVCEAKIVRHVGGGTGLRYTRISAEDRQRLRQYVAARKREILTNLRKKGS